VRGPTGSAGRPGPPPDCARGLNQLEGYLYWQAQTATAGRQAQAFADRLPWLTSGQREEVVRIYTADRLELSRATLDHIAERVRELRSEYAARYHQLKIRVLGLSLLALTALAAVRELLAAS
jgi:hypothetical protein